MEHIRLTTFGSENADYEVLKKVTSGEALNTTWSDLPRILLKFAISPQDFSPGGRTKDHGLGMPSFIMLDSDQDMTLDQAKRAVEGYKAIICTTKSHQKAKRTTSGIVKPACDRFRVAIQLSEPIKDAETWKSTIKWIANEFGIVNDPAITFWSMFFAGREIVLSNMEGKTLKPRTEKEYTKELEEDGDCPNYLEYYKEDCGVLSKGTRRFFRDGSPSGQFNQSLFLAAADCRDQLYTQDDFIEFWERGGFSGKKYPSHTFDDKDMGTIRNVFSKDIQARVVRIPGKKKGRIKHEFKKESIDSLVELMADRFLLENRKDTNIRYEITNKDRGEVRVVTNDHIWKRYAERMRIENQMLTLRGDRVTISNKKWCELWELYGRELENEVEPFLLDYEVGYTLKKLDKEVKAGDFPAWKEFLDRITDPRTFMQWVGSCFDRTNKGRQAYWLWGTKGQDGKSTILRTLVSVFGEAGASLSGTMVANANGHRFLMASLYKKRMTVYPDCKHPMFVQEELFRNLTSNDNVPMEFKGQNIFTAPLYVKLAVASNQRPLPGNIGNADISRLLISKVRESSDKDDDEWEKKLHLEIGYFIHACRAEYDKVRYINGKRVNDIPVTAEMRELLGESASITVERFEVIADLMKFDYSIPVSQAGIRCVDRARMWNFLCSDRVKNLGLRGDKSIEKIQDYFERKKNIKRVTVGDKVYYWPIIEVGESDRDRELNM